ncbi:unnamed protein product [Cunninghamella blakesleeana]
MSWNDDSYGNNNVYNNGGRSRQITPREGDWDCSSCGRSNFAKRRECFKCNEPRPEGMGKPAGPPPSDCPDRDYNWASNCARYEYSSSNFDENGLAPRDANLEQELFEFSAENQTNLISPVMKISLFVLNVFDEANLHPVVKENIRLAKYTKPTPVQQYSIPIVTEGKDLMACAQTGSGKTAAFLIPALSALFDKPELAKPRCQPYEYRNYCAEPLVLILAPTRELCSQIFDECRRWTYRSHLRPCAVYGGANAVSQIRQLERGCDILAAAPGRLIDFIDRRKVSLNRVRYLILDEADRMLDMGFEGIIRNIVEKRGLSDDRQTLMFSATFPRAIRKLARDFLRPDYLFLKVGRVGGTTNSITQKVMYVPEDEKREALRNLLNSQPPSRTLVFVETKRSADSLDQYLYERSFPSTSIHGDRTQMEREDALLAFKSGQCPILVATAVAARGIDIRNVMHVVNYDMPNDMDEYIHRIGRTARVGKSGLATSFYNERSELLAPELTKLLKENKQVIPDFLEQYITEEIVWEEDLDDENVPAPSYAGQEWTPQERPVPGGPGSFANSAHNDKPSGSADATWDSNNAGSSSGAWDSGNAGWDSGNAGWDSGNTADNNTSSGGGWGASEPTDNNASSGSGWGTSEPTANSSSGDGWGTSEPTANSSSSGWGTSESANNNYSNNNRGDYNRTNGGYSRDRGDRPERRGPPPRRDGDWDCSSCGGVNYARRTECFKCNTPKDGTSRGSYDNNTSSYDDNNSSSNQEASWQSTPAADNKVNNNDEGWGSSDATPAPASNDSGWGAPEASNDNDGGWGSPPAKNDSGW